MVVFCNVAVYLVFGGCFVVEVIVLLLRCLLFGELGWVFVLDVYYVGIETFDDFVG